MEEKTKKKNRSSARSFRNASERLGRRSGFEQIGTHSTSERRMQDDELLEPVEFFLPILMVFLDYYYRFSGTFASNDFFQLSTIVCIPALFENLDL